MDVQNNQVYLVSKKAPNNNQAIRYQIKNLISRLNTRFPSIFPSTNVEDYMISDQSKLDDAKLLICLDRESYKTYNKKCGEKRTKVIKLSHDHLVPKGTNQVRLSKVDRIHINIKVLKMMNELEQKLLGMV